MFVYRVQIWLSRIYTLVPIGYVKSQLHRHNLSQETWQMLMHKKKMFHCLCYYTHVQ